TLGRLRPGGYRRGQRAFVPFIGLFDCLLRYLRFIRTVVEELLDGGLDVPELGIGHSLAVRKVNIRCRETRDRHVRVSPVRDTHCVELDWSRYRAQDESRAHTNCQESNHV